MSRADASLLLHQARKLQAQGRTTESLAISCVLDPQALGDAQLCVELGHLLRLQQRYRLALNAYERALALEPRSGALHFNKAVMQRYLGDFDGAERSCDVVLTINASDGEAQLLRSGLRRQTLQANHVAELEQLVRTDLPYADKAQLHYALAKEYEDLGDHARSFEHARQGADLRRAHMQYDVRADEETIAHIIETHSADFVRANRRGDDSSAPIFIIGLPRTGTTLVERVLGSHSQVYAAGELGNFAQQMVRLIHESGHTSLSRAALIDKTPQLDFAALGRAYVESVQPLTDGSPRFTDKLPLNFLYVGLIALVLPNARIVHVMRDPMDACYSIYKHHFRQAYPYSYSLTDLGRYYIAYAKLMRHWRQVLPGRMHEVAYEDLVNDPVRQSRLLIEYCGLPWEEGCLRSHESASPVTSASAEQVRRPIYDDSIGRWKRVSSHLQALETMLREAGVI